MELITDRTQQDVDRWRELRDKGWADMTAEEKAEWLGVMKGRYAAEDMNRVESATEALTARLTDMGYIYTTLVHKTDWTRSDSPSREDLLRYLDNVARLRRSIKVYEDTPAAPTIDSKLDYKGANDIERILLDIDGITEKVRKARIYAGEIFAGEV